MRLAAHLRKTRPKTLGAAELLAGYAAGLTLTEIVEIYGADAGEVQRLLDGVARPSRRSHLHLAVR